METTAFSNVNEKAEGGREGRVCVVGGGGYTTWSCSKLKKQYVSNLKFNLSALHVRSSEF